MLCEGFGEGEFCTCGEVTLPGKARTCACCLRGRQDLGSERGDKGFRISEVSQDYDKGEAKIEGSGLEDQTQVGEGSFLEPGGPKQSEGPSDEPESGPSSYFSETQVAHLEQKAQDLLDKQQYNHKACEHILKELPYKHPSHHRKAFQQSQPQYIVFGVYAYGNHYGVTDWTRKLPQVCRYLLKYVQHWSTEPVVGTSLVVNNNCTLGIHRDNNNLPGTKNFVIGVTAYQHGEL